MAPNKLYIYDSTSDEDISQADGRFSGNDVITLPIPSLHVLVGALDGLVARGWTFNRVLFQTHGRPGMIMFNGASILPDTLDRVFKPRRHYNLFPQYTRIYFDGCNVAGEERGTIFFQKIGEIFLRIGGGEVFGYTSPGYGVPGGVPFIGGHTMHFTGELKKLYFKPGGLEFTPPPAPVEKEPLSTRRDYVGHNI